LDRFDSFGYIWFDLDRFGLIGIDLDRFGWIGIDWIDLDKFG
jgi:hypothetical protein